MNTPIRILLAVSAATGLALSAVANRSASEVEPSASPVVQDKAMTPLDEAMNVLKGGQRALRKAIKSPAENKDALLANLAKMEVAAHASILMTPRAMAKIPKEELAATTVAYKQKMTTLLVGILAMEEATLSGDAEALKAAYDAISATKKTGHESFRD